jgi:hypothetical protein
LGKLDIGIYLEFGICDLGFKGDVDVLSSCSGP